MTAKKIDPSGRRSNGGARAGAGRKPGSLNKVKRELRDLAGQYTPEALRATVKALRQMVRILDNRKADMPVKIQAASAIGSLSNILFDRGVGKPAQAIAFTGSLKVTDARSKLERLLALESAGDKAPETPRVTH